MNELNNSPKSQTLVLFCMDSYDSESRLILQHFSRSTKSAFLCTVGVFVWEKPGKTHSETPRKLKNTHEKAENSESSENITNKEYENYITPNNRLTISVQQRAVNTRLYKKLRLVQRRQSEQPSFANFTAQISNF